MDLMWMIIFFTIIAALVIAVRRPVIVVDCPHCGRTIPYRTGICPYCGETPEPQFIKRCPTCRRLYPSDMNYCPICRSRLHLR